MKAYYLCLFFLIILNSFILDSMDVQEQKITAKDIREKIVKLKERLKNLLQGGRDYTGPEYYLMACLYLKQAREIGDAALPDEIIKDRLFGKLLKNGICLIKYEDCE